MYRFKKIGVVIDTSSDNQFALEHAKELVVNNQAHITLLFVTSPQMSQEQQTAIIDHLKSSLEYPFDAQFLTGNTVVETVRYSIKNNLDMLLIEEHTKHGIKFFYSSVTQSLIRKAPCPIWVVKKEPNQSYNRILIAVDPVDEDETKAKLNDKLVEIGTSYARMQSAECTLATAWQLEGEQMMTGPFIRIPQEELDDMRTEAKTTHAKAFEALQARHKDALQNCKTTMLHGDAGAALANYINENDFDLVVLGTVARTGIQGFVIGNTAETMLNQIDCSVMAIKPDGFKSPITV